MNRRLFFVGMVAINAPCREGSTEQVNPCPQQLEANVVGGFIYLAMHDRLKSAKGLIGAGFPGLITGFQTVRLGDAAEHEAPASRSARRVKTEE